MSEDIKYMFTASWFDNSAQLLREFYLIYFVQDGTVELYDRKNHKTFLRRMACDTLDEQDLYVGNTVYVLSRKLSLEGYADSFTRQTLECKSERTIVLLKSSAVWTAGKLLDTYHFVVTKLKILQLDEAVIDVLLTCSKFEKWPLRKLLHQNVILVELLGENVVETIYNHITNFSLEAGDSTREDGFLFLSSVSPLMKINHLFSDGQRNHVQFAHCTCCIIKPHVLKDGMVGKILMDIANSGFVITALDMFNLSFDQSRQFYQVYKGVVPEYPGMVSQLCVGPSIGMCIQNPELGNVTLQQFREFVGPIDPDVGRHVRPGTLRSKYGSDKIRNAIHCTDLTGDGVSEVDFLFNRFH